MIYAYVRKATVINFYRLTHNSAFTSNREIFRSVAYVILPIKLIYK